MSNFTGVTFAQQKVLPSDDAVIRRIILSDGILFGCEFSYSGSTLTMGSGQLLICGRQIRHPSAQNWAVTDATSGFARLVLTVDLTKTASKDVFEQVVDSIEYSASQDGFPALNQSDVNTTGSVYQIAACVVSLGTGGITGIVDMIGPCAVSGGGGGLNFNLVGGLTQPTDPVENTIWVNTDFEITGYIFSATEPAEIEPGMVWIYTNTFSPFVFNALKKNCLEVYPFSVKQWIDDALVDVPASIYQNGEWVEILTDLVFFENGVFNTDVWGDPTGTYTLNDNGSFRIKQSKNVASKNYVDISDYKYLTFEIVKYGYGHPTVTLIDASGTTVASFGRYEAVGVLKVDVSSINKAVKIKISAAGNTDTNYSDMDHIKFLRS